jgi:putative flippase GtrA
MHSGIWFILVGVSAGLTHLSIYYIATQGIGILNEWANACGFVIAFFVSFAGHRYLSFKDSGTTIKQSLLRFLITAIAGFMANELIFVLLFRVLGLNDWIALFIAIAGAAAQTFLLSRFWAFKKKNSA